MGMVPAVAACRGQERHDRRGAGAARGRPGRRARRLGPAPLRLHGCSPTWAPTCCASTARRRLRGPADDVLAAAGARLAVDLKDPARRGRAAARRAAPTCSSRRCGPGVAERLGVGPGRCAARNPRLVYARMTGWGQDGPLAPRVGHDLNYLALTGGLHRRDRRARPQAGPAAQPGRRLRRRLDVPRDRRARRARRAGDERLGPGRRRRDGRRRQPRCWHDVGRCGRAGSGGTSAAATCSTAARRSTTPTPAPTAGGWRSARSSRSSGPLVVAGLGLQDLPGQYDDRLAASCAALHGDLRSPAPATSGRRSSPAPDACVTPVLTLGEAPAGAHLAARGTLAVDGTTVRPAPAPRFGRTPGAVVPPPGAEDLLARWLS